MVPGIHNSSTVGSSPMRRDPKTKIIHPRDNLFLQHGTAAGALSSKVNVNKIFLPAMDRGQQQMFNSNQTSPGGPLTRHRSPNINSSQQFKSDFIDNINQVNTLNQSVDFTTNKMENSQPILIQRNNYQPRSKAEPVMNLVDRRAEHLAGRMEKGSRRHQKDHNPITNPLAWKNQNPYIQKDLS